MSEAAGGAATLKRWRRGSHRLCPPEETLERLLPQKAALGITRLADLTGLDRVGLPVAAAYRPNSRSIAVHQGKGPTAEAAKVSAVMEAAECFHAERAAGPLRLARFDELENTIDPRHLPHLDGIDDITARRLLWIEGNDLVSGDRAWVPFELVHADYTHPQPAPCLFNATTNGLGAGNHTLEAQLHALYEVIERDATTGWSEAGGPRASGTRPIALDRLEDPVCRDLIERFAACGTAVAAWEVTTDIAVPVIVALTVPLEGETTGIEAEFGYGCHLDPALALERALSEAAQSRITRISGARDDFPPESYGAGARRSRRERAMRWLAHAERSEPRPLAAPEHPPGDDLALDRAILLERLRAGGCARAVWVDLGDPALGIAVGRIIVPGLESIWLEHAQIPGGRARPALAA